MPHNAVLKIITEINKLEKNLLPFVNFKAGIEGRIIKDNDIVAILQIENIESYYPIFLDGKTTVRYIIDELAKMDTKMDDQTKKELAKHLK
jgi:hypothetical protein